MADVLRHKNIVIFGATGQTGMELVKEALSIGYSVRVLARNPEKAKLLPKEVEVHMGEGNDAEVVGKALEGQDAVLLAVGGQSLKDSTTRSRITGVVLSQMQKHSISRLVVCSVVGIGASSAHMGWFSKMFAGFLLKNAMADHRAQEAAIKKSGLEYVIFRPPQLINAPKTESYKTAEEHEVFRATKISRSDLAHAMIKALEHDAWIGRHLSISS